MRVYRPLTSAPWNDDCMTPLEAKSIDYKMDDGNPSTGMVFGVRSEGSPQMPCNNADRWAPPSTTAVYNVGNDAVECSLYAGFADF